MMSWVQAPLRGVQAPLCVRCSNAAMQRSIPLFFISRYLDKTAAKIKRGLQLIH